MNIYEITDKYEQLIADQKKTIQTMDRLTALAEQMLFELQIRNGGKAHASN